MVNFQSNCRFGRKYESCFLACSFIAHSSLISFNSYLTERLKSLTSNHKSMALKHSKVDWAQGYVTGIDVPPSTYLVEITDGWRRKSYLIPQDYAEGLKFLAKELEAGPKTVRELVELTAKTGLTSWTPLVFDPDVREDITQYLVDIDFKFPTEGRTEDCTLKLKTPLKAPYLVELYEVYWTQQGVKKALLKK